MEIKRFRLGIGATAIIGILIVRWIGAHPSIRKRRCSARVFGPTHYEIAVNLNNLAALRYARGHPREAARLYQQALRIKVKLLGTKHPDVGVTLNNMAVLLKSQREFAEAKRLYRKALSILEKALGPTHSKVVTCRANYAAVLREMRP